MPQFSLIWLFRAFFWFKNVQWVLRSQSTETHSCTQSYVLEHNRLLNKQGISLPCSHKDALVRETRTAVESNPLMKLLRHVNSCCLTVLNHRAENWIEKVYHSPISKAMTWDFFWLKRSWEFYRIFCSTSSTWTNDPLRVIHMDNNIIFSVGSFQLTQII